MSVKTAEQIRKHIKSALDEIEAAIKEDPAHVSCYLGIKEDLLSADSCISFCIND